jgi:hypothetical protein
VSDSVTGHDIRLSAIATWNEDHEHALRTRAAYEIFEEGEGAVWGPRELVDGGMGNARVLSQGLRTGNESLIVEGHGDLRWTTDVLAAKLAPNLGRIAWRHADAHFDMATGRHRFSDVTTLRANILEAACGLPRYAAAVEGRRTLPGAQASLQACLGDLAYNLALVIPIANSEHGLLIRSGRNYAEHLNGLDIRIALQTLYGQWRDGKVTEEEAISVNRELSVQGLRLGLSMDTLRIIWQKAPTRVRDFDLDKALWPAFN